MGSNENIVRLLTVLNVVHSKRKWVEDDVVEKELKLNKKRVVVVEPGAPNKTALTVEPEKIVEIAKESTSAIEINIDEGGDITAEEGKFFK